MDKPYRWERAENCFANARSYICHLEVPVDEELLARIGQQGKIQIKKSFKKPYYFGTLENGVRIKGVVKEYGMKVGFDEEHWEEEKEVFEDQLKDWLSEEVISETQSVCPLCLKKLPARIIRRGQEVYMEKSCPEHGSFSALIWNQGPSYEEWGSQKPPVHPSHPAMQVEKGCPYDCGLCKEHRQLTCCVLMEVTERCNLGCPICFASSETGEDLRKPDVSMEQIGEWYDAMMEGGGPYNIQLSGGEPTMRDDLPEIITLGRQKGFVFFQLNTNGLRLASDEAYVARLKEAGLNCVFLQFDGVTDEVYEVIRGRRLLEQKKRAIEVCKKYGIGVVLVPVIVPGVNEGQVGEILKFALDSMPAVRGVHFQPVSYFGRMEVGEKRRYPLSALLTAIEEQTDGAMKIGDFTPGGAENAYCSFSGNFLQMEDGSLRAWHKENSCGCGSEKGADPDASAKARDFVARRWSASEAAQEECCCGGEVKEEECCCGGEVKEEECCCCGEEAEEKSCCSTDALDDFLRRVDEYSLAVSAMGFMDAGNLDLKRLKECYIHVVTGRDPVKLIPFCAYNLTAEDGTALYRGRES